MKMEKSSAFYAGVVSSLEKEALFGLGVPKPKVPFVPKFKGHSKALGLGTKKTTTGVVTQRTMGPGGLQQQRHVVGVPGWTK